MNLTKVDIYKHNSEATQKQKALRSLFLKLLYALVSWALLNSSTAAVKALMPCMRAIWQLGHYFYFPHCKYDLFSNPLFRECEHVKQIKKKKNETKKWEEKFWNQWHFIRWCNKKREQANVENPAGLFPRFLSNNGILATCLWWEASRSRRSVTSCRWLQHLVRPKSSTRTH